MRNFILAAFIFCYFIIANFTSFAQESSRSPASFDFNDSGIQFMTADSAQKVMMRFRMQNQITYNTISDEDFSAASTELAVRRLRLRFGGVLYKYLSFNIQLGFARRDFDFTDSDVPNIIRDAAVFWNFSPNAQIGIGQTKLPGNRQRVISSGDQQFADRSIVNSFFTLDRDFGIQAFYSTKIENIHFNFRGALSNGDGRYAPQLKGADFCYTGRVEVLPLGKFARGGDYFESDLVREPKPKLSIASTYSINENATRTRGQLGPQLLEKRTLSMLMADALLKYNGFALYAEFAQRMCDDPFTGLDDDAQVYVFAGQGLLLQGSYLFENNLEIAARMAEVTPDKAIQEYKGAELQRHLTGCLTYYISNHRAKAQLEITYNTRENLATDISKSNWIGRFNFELGI
ncbi:MAG: hypothetical protein KGZ71_05975 [Desulfobulbaceae bacterium]|nr:porin [Candidatus Kapabacteria bacterium]MBS4000010.1 hypothetical protein [Desulfobulbaceae bacterium]